MSWVHSVILNTDVIALPYGRCSKHDAIRYVENILYWKKHLDEPWITFYVSDALFYDWYPDTSQLAGLLNRHGIVWYDANTVFAVVNRLLNKAQPFETVYQVSDVISENLEIIPDIIDFSTSEDFRSEIERLVTLIAILQKRCFRSFRGCSLIIKREIQSQKIRIRAQICALDHSRDDIPDMPCSPEYFEGDVQVCKNFRGLVGCLDEAEILVGASDDFEIQLAIRIALYKYAIKNNEYLDWHDAVSPKIGPKFRKSCLQCCKDRGKSLPKQILKSIRRTVIGQKLFAVHALRTDKGANSPQRMRGSDKAQRRDIDREFHLHYWKMPGGKIELASINYHNDFSIPK